jgi:hypothetical protein
MAAMTEFVIAARMPANESKPDQPQQPTVNNCAGNRRGARPIFEAAN